MRTKTNMQSYVEGRRESGRTEPASHLEKHNLIFTTSAEEMLEPMAYIVMDHWSTTRALPQEILREAMTQVCSEVLTQIATERFRECVNILRRQYEQ